MGNFEGHLGTNKLAKVLSKRIKAEYESPLILDFGEIHENGSLLTNTFPVPIPRGQYSICRHVSGLIFQTEGGEHQGHEEQTETHNTGSHTHTVKLPPVAAGNRVLVAWVNSEAVVVDVIVSS